MNKKIRPIVPISERVPAKVASSTGLKLYLPTGEQYFGVYYTVDGQYLTTPNRTTNTVVLSTIPIQFTQDETYLRIKGKLTDKFTPPKPYVPIITEEDISRGYIQRYFVMKRNEVGVFVEVSFDDYNKYSVSNQKAIDANIWQRFELRWLVSGDIENVRTTNRKTLTVYEREDNLTELSKFLFKLDEFYLGKR
jgi:hypothetical protein